MAVYNSGASNQSFVRRAVTGIAPPPTPTQGQLWPRGDKKGSQTGT